MRLIGKLDSPYVRRTAISLRCLGLGFQHQSLSVLRDVEAFALINPLIKAPSLVLDDGTVLNDSGLIIDYAENLSGRSLLPQANAARIQALRLIGLALVACEKVVQLVYERELRPLDKQYPPWQQRLQRQLHAALQSLEDALQAHSGPAWLSGSRLGQADISLAAAWQFYQSTPAAAEAEPALRYPALARFAARAEALDEFKAFPPD